MQGDSWLDREWSSSALDTDQAGWRRAWLTEFKNTAGPFNGRAYWRQNEEGFGLGQQNRSEGGTRKIGADMDFRLSSFLSFKGEVWRQDDLSDGDRRDLVDGRLDRERVLVGPGLAVEEVHAALSALHI